MKPLVTAFIFALLLGVHDSRAEHHSDDDAYIQFAARQSVLDYAVQQGPQVLSAKLDAFSIAEITRHMHIPVVGDVLIKLSQLHVSAFTISADSARLVIMDGFFHLRVHQASAKLGFKWYWEKGIHGSGDGDLLMEGGAIDYVFKVAMNEDTHRPELQVGSHSDIFETVELNIHSASVDWLYQAVMRVLRDVIANTLQGAISSALTQDVPQAVNKVLASLPTSVSIQGLPISFQFDYGVYTLRYVLIKGSAEVVTHQYEDAGIRVVTHKYEDAGIRVVTHQNEHCPYAPSRLPLSSEAIAAAAPTISVYLHENMINCLAWGFFNSGLMKVSIVDGTIPKLHLTTDILGGLIPQLPKAFPHQMLRINVEALEHPKVSFSSSAGAKVQASYRTSIFVDNATLGVPHIATLRANVNISATLTWDATVVTSVVAHHEMEPGAAFQVSTPQLDMTVAWFIQNYAGLFPLSQIVQQYITLPVVSQASLLNAEAKVLDQWFAISGDVQVSL